jgi:hypothetical protein
MHSVQLDQINTGGLSAFSAFRCLDTLPVESCHHQACKVTACVSIARVCLAALVFRDWSDNHGKINLHS